MPNYVMQVCKKLTRRILGVLLVLGFSGAAHAVPAFSITNTTGAALENPPFTLGWQFSTSAPITVTHLGLFDDAQDGLSERHDLGLWDSDGVLLAFATIGAGTSAPLSAQFRYVDIIDVVLAAGTYQVGALYTSPADALVFPGDATGFATASPIDFIASAFIDGGTLANPAFLGGPEPAFFGPNFIFQTFGVPEPATLSLLALGLLAFSGKRRRN